MMVDKKILSPFFSFDNLSFKESFSKESDMAINKAPPQSPHTGVLQNKLHHSLKELLVLYPHQDHIKDQFLSFLETTQYPFHREQENGHVTASIFLLNRNLSSFLLIQHKKLNIWVQPGGHCDGDENVLRVALKEGLEETGIQGIIPISSYIFDLEIYCVPSNNNVLEHLHYDVRFLCKTTDSDTILKNEESHEVAWFDLDAQDNLSVDLSVKRMIHKTHVYFDRKITCLNNASLPVTMMNSL